MRVAPQMWMQLSRAPATAAPAFSASIALAPEAPAPEARGSVASPACVPDDAAARVQAVWRGRQAREDMWYDNEQHATIVEGGQRKSTDESTPA